MLVGLDFDNTIAGYDRAFLAAGLAMGLLAPGAPESKAGIRALLRSRSEGETEWQRLQGRVYGAFMAEAVVADGLLDFLAACRSRAVPVVVVSHKTEFGHFDPDRIDLRRAALDWMAANRLLDTGRTGLDPGRVFFEPTRELKLARIAGLGCSHFVDDLPEVLAAPDFPGATRRILYAPAGGDAGNWTICRSFLQVRQAVLGGGAA
jgi:hypothetical protein